jgi:hypothetical protein
MPGCAPASITTEPIKAQQSIIVYPNPLYSTVTFETTQATATIQEISILDINGRQCYHKKLKLPIGQVKIDIGYLPQGFYTYKVVSSSNQNFIGKLIKE